MDLLETRTARLGWRRNAPRLLLAPALLAAIASTLSASDLIDPAPLDRRLRDLGLWAPLAFVLCSQERRSARRGHRQPRGLLGARARQEPRERSGPDTSWVREARGHALKVISFLLRHLPDENASRIVYMRRHLDEVIRSQDKMLEPPRHAPLGADLEATKES